MSIEILVLISIALSSLSVILMLIVAVRGNGRKDISRLSQEMQDRTASSFDAFRASIEQRLQSLESAISDINTSQKGQMALFFRENRELNDKLDRRQKKAEGGHGFNLRDTL